MSLSEYRRKRRFRRTSEPRPGDRPPPPARARFVVQLHRSRRRHYDLRLQVGDALKSWAVPKGPSLDPSVRRLAVEVEDHPLEYAAFEGEIPEGEYGAGHVSIFDEGTWTTDSDAREQLERGSLAFELFGERLSGQWRLVRTEGRRWLLVKARDAGAVGGDAPLDAPRCPESSAPPPRWAARASALSSARRGPAPAAPFVPALAKPSERPPEGSRWLHEIKWDGYRLLATIASGRVRLWSRNHLEWTERLPEIAQALGALGLSSAALDGELIAGGGRRDDFGLLEAVLAGREPAMTRYALFDVLHLDGVDVSRAPLRERKALLAELLEGAPARLVLSTHVESEGAAAASLAAEHGFEGVVSKRADLPYEGGRRDRWRKTKRALGDELVVVGLTQGGGAAAGSLLVAAPDARGALRYRGRVGSGLTDGIARALGALPGRDEAPQGLIGAPARLPRGSLWVEPRVVAEVSHRGLTRRGLLRQPSLKALREDKSLEELTMDAKREGAAITSPERTVDPRSRLTKRDVAEYYEAAMPFILPELTGRPVSIVRCPSGLAGECFYQKHPTRGLRRIGATRPGRGRDEVLVVRDAAGLMELVQMNAIELHPWGAREPDLERADRLVFDLDPGAGVDFSEVVAAARRVRDLLKRAGLRSFVRTTGGKGLHVVAPLRPAAPFERALAFARAFAEGLALLEPARFVASADKRIRAGRIYVDYLRNARGATAVASLSLRARPGLPVAMPLRWRELGAIEGGADHPLARARARLARLRSHPWEGIDALEQGLDTALDRLSGSLRRRR